MTRNPQTPPPRNALTEGIDYYVENGFWVFTAKYHLDRGSCCGSGCRHCPYRDGEGGSSNVVSKGDGEGSSRID